MFEEEIKELLDLYELDDLFDELDITKEEVLTILLEGGHVALPPYLEKTYDETTY